MTKAATKKMVLDLLRLAENIVSRLRDAVIDDGEDVGAQPISSRVTHAMTPWGMYRIDEADGTCTFLDLLRAVEGAQLRGEEIYELRATGGRVSVLGLASRTPGA